MEDRIFDYWSETEDTTRWHSIFVKRAQPNPEAEWSWCPASFTHRYKEGAVCEDCGQQIRKIQKALIRPHLTRETSPGIYLIDVGRYRSASGSRYLKIGMSQAPVAGRLENHLQNPDHERCVVHYCFPIEPADRLTWQIPTIVESLLQAHLIQTKAEKTNDSYEYFTWSDELLQRCIDYLERPQLVSKIHRLLE